MKIIPAFQTPDNKRFFDEAEARTHERRYDFGNHVDLAVRGNPQFARLDRELLLDFLMKHGSTCGKLADSPITPERPFGSGGAQDTAERAVPRAFENVQRFGEKGGIVGGDLAQSRAEGMEPKKPTTGILPHPTSPEGQRRMAESEKRAKEILTGDSAMDAMADELERELNKSVS